jgi:hypothetical protein
LLRKRKTQNRLEFPVRQQPQQPSPKMILLFSLSALLITARRLDDRQTRNSGLFAFDQNGISYRNSIAPPFGQAPRA